MIDITVQAGKDPEARLHELCEAVRHARVWTIRDRRRTRNLRLDHSSGNVHGSIRRIHSADTERLEFECTAKDDAQAAITTGRFVNLVLRDLESASDITIHRT